MTTEVLNGEESTAGSTKNIDVSISTSFQNKLDVARPKEETCSIVQRKVAQSHSIIP